MGRPKCCRTVAGEPAVKVFKPIGIPAMSLEEVVLSVDEFEAIRLADLEGLYQEQAAERMGVSRQTFGRIVESARRKVAQALVLGLALRIEGGAVESARMRAFQCNQCRHAWGVPPGSGRPLECPVCKSNSLHHSKERRETSGGDCPTGRCRRA